MNTIYQNIFVSIVLIIFAIDGSDCLNSCNSDWKAFENKKCFKILDIAGTQEEGVGKCAELGDSSTLITIETNEEQEFIYDMSSKYSDKYDNIWIGLKYRNNTFKWLDGMEVKYSNWADSAVRDGSLPCAEMELRKGSGGKWMDDSCIKSQLIGCQMRQQWTVDTLVTIVTNMSMVISEQRDELDALNAKIKHLEQTVDTSVTIPIGFIYTQLLNQSSPTELWPSTEWSEVTQQYSGLFFRAEGGESLPFGQIQRQNYSSVAYIVANSLMAVTHNNNTGTQLFEMVEGAWSPDLVPGDIESALRAMKLFTTKGENRPINTAIKIWKRMK